MSPVIEHLRTAHHLALRAQHDSAFDAADLLRAWPRVVSAAYAVHRCFSTTDRDSDRVVQRIAVATEALSQGGDARGWPGPGRSDAKLQQVAAAFRSAVSDPSAHLHKSDHPEARWLIASSLWATSRIIVRSLRDYSSDLRWGRNQPSGDPVALSNLATQVRYRFDAIEQLAAGSLHQVEQQSSSSHETGIPLGRSIATWDIEAHRALLTIQSTAVLHVLSHLQAESMKATEVLIVRATHHGAIDSVSASRLCPVLRDSSSSWERLRDASAELSFGSTAVPMAFINAARGLQEDILDAARSPQHGAYPRLIQAVSSHIGSSVSIAAAACDLIDTKELRAPARAMARLLAETPDFQDVIAAPVDPIAVRRGHTLPLHEGVRRLLEDPARQAFRHAHEAVDRSAGLESLFRRIPQTTDQEGPPLTEERLALVKHRSQPQPQPPSR
jgi:hypothetical protein